MTIELAETIASIRQRVLDTRREGRTVGFVPTMGALHAGHGALIAQAVQECDFVVVSIFVNPIQFDRTDDFDKYPRTLATDMDFCERHGAHAVFAPPAREMYPDPILTLVEVSVLGEKLCGEFRPGHFKGVATVVAKLFNIVPADRVYFGEKDAQQLAVIARMAADLNFPCKIVPVPTVREHDGLAMSSRNVRLSPEDRQVAPVVYRALSAAAAAIQRGASVQTARDGAMSQLSTAPAISVEYLEFVDPHTMQPVAAAELPVRAVIAVWLGGVRLIDNVLCTPPPRRLSE